jgi:predicted small lipoprotein YifL
MRGHLALAVLLALAATLGGCGVRGSLEAPPRVKNETGDAVPGRTADSPGPHKPSILDPLIR